MTLTFPALYQGHNIQAQLRPRGILLNWNEEDEIPFSGSLHIYWNPSQVPQDPYDIEDEDFEQSVSNFLTNTFGFDFNINYSESGRQGDDFTDFDIGNPEQLFCIIPNPILNVYITQDSAKFHHW